MELCKLLSNVVSSARALGLSELTASCKLLLTTLDDSVWPLLPVAVAAAAVTALDGIEIVVVTDGGFASTDVCRLLATVELKVLVPLVAPLAAWFNV